jgi:site-specific DNA-methyltransferase (adenine-specific)
VILIGMPPPFYADAHVTLYCGDMREVLPQLALAADLVVADPPYGETPLRWDRWPPGWPTVARAVARSMWCFGSIRMFLAQRDEFAGWRLSQDVVWEKHNGSGFTTAGRFSRVHEQILHWYAGPWRDVYAQVPRVPGQARPTATIRQRGGVTQTRSPIGQRGYEYGTTRLARSVLAFRSMHGRAVHPTQKPVPLLEMLVRFGCPPGGLVVDPFAGSGATGAAARAAGCRAVLVEGDERSCEVIARRLSEIEDAGPVDATPAVVRPPPRL